MPALAASTIASVRGEPAMGRVALAGQPQAPGLGRRFRGSAVRASRSTSCASTGAGSADQPLARGGGHEAARGRAKKRKPSFPSARINPRLTADWVTWRAEAALVVLPAAARTISRSRLMKLCRRELARHSIAAASQSRT